LRSIVGRSRPVPDEARPRAVPLHGLIDVALLLEPRVRLDVGETDHDLPLQEPKNLLPERAPVRVTFRRLVPVLCLLTFAEPAFDLGLHEPLNLVALSRLERVDLYRRSFAHVRVPRRPGWSFSIHSHVPTGSTRWCTTCPNFFAAARSRSQSWSDTFITSAAATSLTLTSSSPISSSFLSIHSLRFRSLSNAKIGRRAPPRFPSTSYWKVGRQARSAAYPSFL